MAQCAVCGSHTTRTCNNCNASAYCSSKCQILDELLHLFFCEAYIFFPTNHLRPRNTIHNTYVLGILFPSTSNTPELVWAKVSTQSTGSNNWVKTTQTPDRHQIFGTFSRKAYSEFGAGIMDHSLQLWKELPSTTSTASENECPQYLLTSCPVSQYRASILILSKPLSPNGNHSLPIYQDITLSSLRLALNYFESQVNVRNMEFNLFLIAEEFEWIRGVEISCQNDQKFLGYQPFRAVKVRRTHPVFGKGIICEMSRHVEVPILLMKKPASSRWEGKDSPPSLLEGDGDEDEYVKDAHFLTLFTNP